MTSGEPFFLYVTCDFACQVLETSSRALRRLRKRMSLRVIIDALERDWRLNRLELVFCVERARRALEEPENQRGMQRHVEAVSAFRC